MLPLGKTRGLVSFLHPCSSGGLTESFSLLRLGKRLRLPPQAGSRPAMGNQQGSSKPTTIPFQGQLCSTHSSPEQNQERTKGRALKEERALRGWGRDFLRSLSFRKSLLVVDTMHEDHHLMSNQSLPGALPTKTKAQPT